MAIDTEKNTLIYVSKKTRDKLKQYKGPESMKRFVEMLIDEHERRLMTSIQPSQLNQDRPLDSPPLSSSSDTSEGLDTIINKREEPVKTEGEEVENGI